MMLRGNSGVQRWANIFPDFFKRKNNNIFLINLQFLPSKDFSSLIVFAFLLLLTLRELWSKLPKIFYLLELKLDGIQFILFELT